MISRVNSSMAQNVYANNASETKENKNVGTQNAKENSRVEQLKESISSGEYKVDLSALSKKMADELL
ncbi:flagellar biosynthesis anti-sigma factor FlgM [Sulfurimonas marina]|uniref:Flagellar biosynthesis anti-sigma factor FlgM n=1 Tax=Sulfurimonas marina TaxID=2590551 RepID=A0A7M1AW16_9BACT|nr:flagellar biosynthesis anti-sigma factor FlgM [Sulfurimonas marina]QOP40788.1 flagellar biosynthesis anti-sigma factor FlgM [Sulfurimonas marina]